MKKKLGLTVFLVVGAAVFAAAAAPNFSGTWKQNNAKSNFGPGRAPKSYLNQIEQSGTELKVVTTLATDAGERSYDRVYHIDGKEEVTNDGTQESRTVVRWVNQTLVFEITSKDQGREYNTRETWALSQDGKTLTKVRHVKEPKGELEQTFILERQ